MVGPNWVAGSFSSAGPRASLRSRATRCTSGASGASGGILAGVTPAQLTLLKGNYRKCNVQSSVTARAPRSATAGVTHKFATVAFFLILFYFFVLATETSNLLDKRRKLFSVSAENPIREAPRADGSIPQAENPPPDPLTKKKKRISRIGASRNGRSKGCDPFPEAIYGLQL